MFLGDVLVVVDLAFVVGKNVARALGGRAPAVVLGQGDEHKLERCPEGPVTGQIPPVKSDRRPQPITMCGEQTAMIG